MPAGRPTPGRNIDWLDAGARILVAATAADPDIQVRDVHGPTAGPLRVRRRLHEVVVHCADAPRCRCALRSVSGAGGRCAQRMAGPGDHAGCLTSVGSRSTRTLTTTAWAGRRTDHRDEQGADPARQGRRGPARPATDLLLVTTRRRCGRRHEGRGVPRCRPATSWLAGWHSLTSQPRAHPRWPPCWRNDDIEREEPGHAGRSVQRRYRDRRLGRPRGWMRCRSGRGRFPRPSRWAGCSCNDGTVVAADSGDGGTVASAFRVVHDQVTAVFRHDDLEAALAATDLTGTTRSSQGGGDGRGQRYRQRQGDPADRRAGDLDGHTLAGRHITQGPVLRR